MEERLLKRFIARFTGSRKAYGSYTLPGGRVPGKKYTGEVKTLRAPVTEDLWIKHLSGEAGLGIIPIDEKNSVCWGCIDVDRYEVDGDATVKLVCNKLDRFDLPLIPCRTKSGGAHIFCFTKDRVPAKLMQEKLRSIAAALGFGGSEIYPKQTQLIAELGDVGQWLNIPYFEADNTERYCFTDGRALSLEEFLDFADQKELSLDDLKTMRDGSVIADERADASGDDPVKDGPPCLQHLVTQGFPDGTRNNALYNIGVYLKKRHPDDWQTLLPTYNVQFMRPPLSASDVGVIVKSLQRRDYSYKCNDIPICDHCDKNACLLRKFGVSSAEHDFPDVTNLCKLMTDPPQYFLDVNGKRIGPVEIVDLLSQDRFARIIAETINLVPPKLKSNKWRVLLQDLMDRLTPVEMPEDSSDEGQLFLHLEQFMRSKAAAEDRQELLIGKPVIEEGNFMFRLKDFITFLERMKFTHMKANKISALLKKRGVESKVVRLVKTSVSVWVIKKDSDELQLTRPKQAKAPF